MMLELNNLPSGPEQLERYGNRKFTAREDDGTGLYYYRARYYQPALGRFVSEDPIEYGGGHINLFVYVGNNPVFWVDSLGFELGDWWDARTYWFGRDAFGSSLERQVQSMGGSVKDLVKRDWSSLAGRYSDSALGQLDFGNWYTLDEWRRLQCEYERNTWRYFAAFGMSATAARYSPYPWALVSNLGVGSFFFGASFGSGLGADLSRLGAALADN